MTLGEWLRYSESINRDDPDARADGVWIAEETLGVPRAKLLFSREKLLTDGELLALNAALDRHMGGEPIQYIFGKAPFMGFEFYVDARVLIPRQDTETLVESVLEVMKPECSVLDLCAGSGAIGVSIKRLRPQTRVTLADISSGALDVIGRNAQGSDVEILQSDMFSALIGRKFDIIACNPPYIPSRDINALQKEVRREPKLALDGGNDGLTFYRILAGEAGLHMNRGGKLFMEVGAGQAREVADMFDKARIVRDLNGIERVVSADFD